MTTPDPHSSPRPSAPGSPATGGPATGGRTAAPPAPSRRRGRALGRGLALALLVFVTVVLVLFVVFNTQTVRVSLVFGDVDAPLVVALVIAAALGGLLVALAGAVLNARRRNR